MQEAIDRQCCGMSLFHDLLLWTDKPITSKRNTRPRPLNHLNRTFERFLRRLQKFLEDFTAIFVISDLESTKIENKKFRFIGTLISFSLNYVTPTLHNDYDLMI